MTTTNTLEFLYKALKVTDDTIGLDYNIDGNEDLVQAERSLLGSKKASNGIVTFMHNLDNNLYNNKKYNVFVFHIRALIDTHIRKIIFAKLNSNIENIYG